MSGSSYRDYSRKYGSTIARLSSGSAAEREQAEGERAARLDARRNEIREGRVDKPKQRDTSEVYDRSAVKLGITAPPAEARRLHIVLVDNSGSNREIADHLKKSSAYVCSTLRNVDKDSAIAWIFFSDHEDGPGLMQEVDYVRPDEAGDRVMHSTLRHVRDADGGDAPEAIECALWRACEIDFGSVPKDQRFLYLVTDVVAHGMGMRGDRGCPERRDWRSSVQRVGQTYGGFMVVGCTTDRVTAELQAKFLTPERVAYDLIDLSQIKEVKHRLRITATALLFLIARQMGMQTAGNFLFFLYEKWLDDPIFGANTDLAAKEAIGRFLKYLELDKAELEALENRIFAETE